MQPANEDEYWELKAEVAAERRRLAVLSVVAIALGLFLLVMRASTTR